MPPSKNISFDELAKFFHLPINQVAKELGVCATILKKICRRNGIPRWPHRKIKSLDKMISQLNLSLEKNPREKDEIFKEIELLKAKKAEIMKHPDILVQKSSQLGSEYLSRPLSTKNKSNSSNRVSPYGLTVKDLVTVAEEESDDEDANHLLKLGTLKESSEQQDTQNQIERKTEIASSVVSLSSKITNEHATSYGIELPRIDSGASMGHTLPPLANSTYPIPSFNFYIPSFDYSILNNNQLPSLRMDPHRNSAILQPFGQNSSPKHTLASNSMNSSAPKLSLPEWFDQEKERVLRNS